jgi:ADP-ribose pyrophosphatase YjhB (NUDIX family)
MDTNSAIALGLVVAVFIGCLVSIWCERRRRVPFQPWRYCPWCRGNLVLATIEGKEKRKCTKCRFVHWDNPRPVAVVLIPTTDGGWVMIRRNVEPRKGKVALPGGFVESYESLIAGAIREAFEETGIVVEIERELCVLMPPGVNEHLHFYLAKPTSAQPAKGSDAAEAFIAYRTNIPADIAFQTHQQVIEDWLRATA